MNKSLHRLVFSRRHGMLVAVAENARAHGKTARGERRGTARATALAAAVAMLPLAPAAAQTRPPVVFASKLPAPKFTLPQPYTTLMQDPAGRSFATPIAGTGTVTWRIDGNTATLDQGSVDRVLLNWQNFDIGAGYTVHFAQNMDPAKYVSALNRVWSTQPSQILGTLTADREVILVNSQGVYFGRGARVNAGKLVASALSLSDATFKQGLRNVTDGSAVFSTAGTDYQPTHLIDSADSRSAAISVESGAEIRSAAGGDVLLIAPRVLNAGRIETPRGQTVLAAGDKVYLMSSSDSRQRGLIVAVDAITAGSEAAPDPGLGVVENSASGSYKTVNGATVADSTPETTAGLVSRINEIRAESGTVNLVGLTVRQKGQINATTAVKGANGAIYLQSMATTTPLEGGLDASAPTSRRGLLVEAGAFARVGLDLGSVEVGPTSSTSVRPAEDTRTQLDAEVFSPSLIRLEGAAIAVESGARIEAPSGQIQLLAARNTLRRPAFDNGISDVPFAADDSRIVIAPGATVSAAGLQGVAVDGARNQGNQRLFQIELADAPVQRSGPLYRSKVLFDLRSGSKITAADVTGAANAVERSAEEHSTAGGTIDIQSEGDLVIAPQVALDVSGGSVSYSTATIKNTLISQDGHTVLFANAAAGLSIDAVLPATLNTVVPAYLEGRDGGSLLVSARRAAVAAQLLGSVIEGPYQRDGRSARAVPALLSLGKELNGRFYLGTIELQPDRTAAPDAALLADPLGAPLSGLDGPTAFSLQDVQAASFGRVLLKAAEVTQSTPYPLALGSGGVLNIQAGAIDLSGSFSAPGGSITLVSLITNTPSGETTSGDIRLAGSARLDAAGLWTNDNAAAGLGRGGNVQTASGSISVRAAHSLLAEPGTTLDVSAGAYLTSSGRLTLGKAGALTLDAGTGLPGASSFALSLEGVQLRGFDFAAGGTLELGAPSLTLGDPNAAEFRLAGDFFSSGGFGSIAVQSVRDVKLASGTLLAPRLQNWQFNDNYRSATSGAMSAGVVAPATIADRVAERNPVNVTLASLQGLDQGGGNLIVERGAGIVLEHGASLTLRATGSILIGTSGGSDGEAAVLEARGGNMLLAIDGQRGGPNGRASEDPYGFRADQAIWLGAAARLSVAGVATLREDGSAATVQFGARPEADAGQRQVGSVLGGGTLTLAAGRGYVVSERGSSINLDGIEVAVNLPGLVNRVTLARSAGTLSVSTPEGFSLKGDISARAPMGPDGSPRADGGRLLLAVGEGGVSSATQGTPYPDSGGVLKPRTIALGVAGGLLATSGTRAGADLSAVLDNGIGYADVRLLNNSGFDALRLAAGDQVRFDASVTLHKPLGIEIEAPAIAGKPGVLAELSGSHIAIGDTRQTGIAGDASAAPDESIDHSTRLRLSAPEIDVYNDLGFRGFSGVELAAGSRSDGEVRFTSTRFFPQTGTLNFAGQLAITAGQAYATSGTAFSIAGLPALDPQDPGSELLVQAPAGGSTSLPPLSAFGQLTVSATNIDQSGVLRQPFGVIALTAARRLVLGDASETSVSGDGATVPVGQTENLARWLVKGFYTDAPPVEKSLSLSAPSLTASATATVSARGGGDVLAWEFFPGVGGSKDYFDTAGVYAVLPDYSATRALSFGGGVPTGIGGGSQIEIGMAGSGLPPGRYTLLPARYALLGAALPGGAFLVSLAPDQGKNVLQAALRQDDGSVVVTGYLTEAGSVQAGTPGERFVVEPQTTFQAKSDVRSTGISDFLTQRAQTLGSAQTPSLPRDGGRILVEMTGQERAQFAAAIDLHPGGGSAGLLDVSAAHLALVDSLDRTPDGALGLATSSIGNSGAGSVLLGGKRTLESSADAALPSWSVDASRTQSVSVDIGAQALGVQELLLASSSTIAMADGTQIEAASAQPLAPRSLVFQGDGALVAVGSGALTLTRAAGALGSGSVSLGQGVRLSGLQVALDATSSLNIGPDTRLAGVSLFIGAPRIVVGTPDLADAQTTVLDGELLDSIRGTGELSLRSYTSIDFAGRQDWAQRLAASAAQRDPAAASVLGRLVLDAPYVRGVAGAGSVATWVDIAANSLTIQNTTGRDVGVTAGGSGSLQLQATGGAPSRLVVGPGSVVVGANEVRLQSDGDVVLQGSGDLSASGNLTVAAARVTATNGADQSLVSTDGVLAIQSEPAAVASGDAAGVGATVRLSGRSVVQQGVIVLPSGHLQIDAQTGAPTAVTFTAGSLTSVAGAVRTGTDGTQAQANGGEIDVRAASGRIEVLGTLDVSAATLANGTRAGDAGSISLGATGTDGGVAFGPDAANRQGVLLGRKGGGALDLGGTLHFDVTRAPSLDALAVNAAQGGFTREVTARARSGDVALTSDLNAQRIQVSADRGSLNLQSALDARAASGGVVQLMAAGDVVLAAGAHIDARSTRAGANGGDVLLASVSGRVRLAAASSIDASGDDAADGRIVLRSQRSANAVNVDALNATNLNAAEVAVEAVRVYNSVTANGMTRDIAAIANGNSTITGSGAGQTGVLGQATVRADSAAFMNTASSILDTLGVSATDRQRVRVRAGVEVQTSGDLNVAADWALNADRPGNDAGFLTLRAAGNLNLNGSLSDGFNSVLTSGTLSADPRSWSYRLVGGADLTAANPLATRDVGGGVTDSGNLSIAGGKLVRTGAGSIELAAGRDIRFGAGSGSTPAGQAYVAGRAASVQAAINATLFSRQSAKPIFSEAGGRLEVAAVRDVTTPEATQLINNWFWRSGLPSALASESGLYSATSQLAWWTQFSRFAQTLGSFGGSDLRLTAGRDLVNVQAMVPTVAWSDNRLRSAGVLSVLDGGDLLVRSGRDVIGGQFFVARGTGRIEAGRDISEATGNTGLRAPVLALMDGSWRVHALRDVATYGAFNPTAMPASAADSRRTASGIFVSFTDASSLALTSASGALRWLSFGQGVPYGLYSNDGALAFQLAPPSLRATALAGSIELFEDGSGGAAMFPAVRGQLEWWSGSNIAIGGPFAMGDTAPSSWPDFRNPATPNSGAIDNAQTGLVAATLGDSATKSALHADDPNPVRVHAEGSILSQLASALVLPKPAEIVASQDITGLRLSGQNLRGTDSTRIAAGRNFLAGNFGAVTLSGPGILDVSAGRQVDLGSSAGITTTGNQSNPALPARGASISVAAATAGVLDPDAFQSAFLAPPTQGGSENWQHYRQLLTDSVRDALDQPGLSYEQAWARFRTLHAQTQAALGSRVLAEEFGAVYLAAAAPTAAQFTDSLRAAFETHKSQILNAGAAALAGGAGLTLPGREVLQGLALSAYLDDLRALSFSSLDLGSTVAARVTRLTAVRDGWHETVAISLGGTPQAFDALAARDAQDPAVLTYRAALVDYTGRRFGDYRNQAMAGELVSAGAAASNFGRQTLAMRLALFDQGFRAAELSGAGSFAALPIWSGAAPVLDYSGALEMTQSSVVTERGGNISLANAGGAISVGLKSSSTGAAGAPKGVIALGGGDVFGYARGDFQVNTQRVFIVGQGDMNIWTTSGDIDSGRGANTAVAAPPLTARRSVDGVVFEVPATTTGSGLGILEDATGHRSGTIGLYPAFGEILALDAFIRAPSVVLGSAVKGADNLISASVGGAVAAVSAPPVTVAPPATSNESRAAPATTSNPSQETRPRNSLLTVELLGLGAAVSEDECSEQNVRDRKCQRAKPSCSDEQRLNSECQ